MILGEECSTNKTHYEQFSLIVVVCGNDLGRLGEEPQLGQWLDKRQFIPQKKCRNGKHFSFTSLVSWVVKVTKENILSNLKDSVNKISK